MLISEPYRQTNAELHKKASYGIGGYRWAGEVRALQKVYGRDVLDYGCGKGSLSRVLDGVRNYDPAIPQYSSDPKPADIVVCTDVLEHIEPEYLDEVLQHIASKMKQAGLFTIATRPARKTLPDGRNAHLILRPKDWWIEKIGKLFYLDEIESINPEEVALIVEKKDER